MNMQQFSVFIQDVRVKGKGLPNSQIKKIFEIANVDESDMNNIDEALLKKLQGDDVDDIDEDEDEQTEDGSDDTAQIQQTFELFDENPDDTLVGHEFVECLVRIARRKFPT